jgi:hypothetical protein
MTERVQDFLGIRCGSDGLETAADALLPPERGTA